MGFSNWGQFNFLNLTYNMQTPFEGPSTQSAGPDGGDPAVESCSSHGELLTVLSL